jgi:NAD(P)-dependent dehydrogenase (short-subunit alcohol dehydrogenase family)
MLALVTGGSQGIGYEAAKTLYHLNGIVYITSRSAASAQSAITSIKSSSPQPSQVVPSGQGRIDFVVMNFFDLRTIQGSAQQLLSKVDRLDVIIHNAGVMLPDNPDKTTAQGWHQQLGINALAPFLLQLFLNPLLLHTTSLPTTPPNSVRIIFLSSSGHRAAPLPDGVAWSDINLIHTTKSGLRKAAERYGQSKAMNCMFAYEFARRYKEKGSGIVSLSLHPGALKTVRYSPSHNPHYFLPPQAGAVRHTKSPEAIPRILALITRFLLDQAEVLTASRDYRKTRQGGSTSSSGQCEKRRGSVHLQCYGLVSGN